MQTGELALQRISRLLGKYGYTDRSTIELRLAKALQQAKASQYFSYTLAGTAEVQNWQLHWQHRQAIIPDAERFDGILLLCTNVPADQCSAERS